ncbi:hypothetical protein HD806DRAFT_532877 [Xylariaceae sp. AK1471]|nr:hypothetical protein HD806DRAFT_532877 [Xylariaceae sp. AK1471]
MPFHFVDNSIIDSKARKLIRSHVMKGKNVGKTRTPRRKYSRPTPSSSTIAGRTGNASDGKESPNSSESTIIAVTRQVCNDLSFLSFPAKVARQSMIHLRQLFFYLLDVMCPPEFCRHTGISEWMWFQLLFRDEAYFHCTIALSSACAAFLTKESYDSPVALYHMAQTFCLINQKLSSNEALSDSTIAVVTSTSVYDRLYGNPQKAMIHLEGVSRIIALRGGIGELAKRNFIIAEKAFRSDFELALYGSKPKFCADDVPRHLILIAPMDRPESSEHEEAESVLYQSVCAELRKVVLDTLSLSYILRDQADRVQRLDPQAFQSTLIYVGYRLIEVDLSHRGSVVGTNLNILIQLAMIGFQNTFWLGIGRKLIAFPVLADRFRSAAQNIYEDHRPPQRTVVFWALLIGRMSLLTNADDLWVVPKLKTLTRQLELCTWSEASDALDAFPWVKAVHDAPGELFWNATLAQPLPLEPAEASRDFTGSSLMQRAS